MFDDILGSSNTTHAASFLKYYNSNKGSSSPHSSAVTTSNDNVSLMTSMIARLGILEKAQTKLKLDIVEKDLYIDKLTKENTLLLIEKKKNNNNNNKQQEVFNNNNRSLFNNNNRSSGVLLGGGLINDNNDLLEPLTPRMGHSNDIIIENDNLKSKIEEMEKFLSDYGLTWVGGKDGCIITPREEEIQDSGPDYKKEKILFCSPLKKSGISVTANNDGDTKRLKTEIDTNRLIKQLKYLTGIDRLYFFMCLCTK